MGVYSGANLFSNGDIDVPVAEGYNSKYAAQMVMIESCENELAMFEGTIRNDFTEAYMIIEGANESDVLAFNEGVISDLIGKIKEFFQKLWSKIKAIFRSFMAKIDSVFMKSNKEFVEKYKKEVFAKNLSDFEVKGRKPNGKTIGDFPNKDIKADTIFSGKKTLDEYNDALNKYNEDTDDHICSILSSTIGGTSISESKDYEKEAIDYCFDEEDSNEIKDIHGIAAELLGFKDSKKNLKKANDSLDKVIKNIVKYLDKEEKEILKDMPVNDTDTVDIIKTKDISVNKSNDEYESINMTKMNATARNKIKTGKALKLYHKKINYMQAQASEIQTAINKYTAVNMKIENMRNAWNRKVWAAAVAYKRKEEDATLTEAWMDYAEFTAE